MFWTFNFNRRPILGLISSAVCIEETVILRALRQFVGDEIPPVLPHLCGLQALRHFHKGQCSLSLLAVGPCSLVDNPMILEPRTWYAWTMAEHPGKVEGRKIVAITHCSYYPPAGSLGCLTLWCSLKTIMGPYVQNLRV